MSNSFSTNHIYVNNFYTANGFDAGGGDSTPGVNVSTLLNSDSIVSGARLCGDVSSSSGDKWELYYSTDHGASYQASGLILEPSSSRIATNSIESLSLPAGSLITWKCIAKNVFGYVAIAINIT